MILSLPWILGVRPGALPDGSMTTISKPKKGRIIQVVKAEVQLTNRAQDPRNQRGGSSRQAYSSTVMLFPARLR